MHSVIACVPPIVSTENQVAFAHSLNSARRSEGRARKIAYGPVCDRRIRRSRRGLDENEVGTLGDEFTGFFYAAPRIREIIS
jgi:hypothetical protein